MNNEKKKYRDMMRLQNMQLHVKNLMTKGISIRQIIEKYQKQLRR